MRLITANQRSAHVFDQLGPAAAFGRLEAILFRTEPDHVDLLREAFVESELGDRELLQAA